MRIRFWGVRGSIPTPLTPAGLRSKISSIVERLSPDDLRTPSSRELFLASLPEYLFSTIGGNTPCVEMVTREPCRFIFDAGTGIRELGYEILAERRPADCRLFLTHFHWDHIQGLPFFGPAYVSANAVHFYSPVDNLEEILGGQMRPPYFPVTMAAMAAQKEFHRLGAEPFRLGGVTISHKLVNHPGGAYSYKLSESGVSVAYCTDTELREEDFRKTPENVEYFSGLDALIIDSQYTLGEAIEKYNWGHSSFSLAADFAASWGIKRLVLFHHEPAYSDRKVFGIPKSASLYLERLDRGGMEIILAREGLELEVCP